MPVNEKALPLLGNYCDSVDGEYLQCGARVFCALEEERIIYFNAFCDLLLHGYVEPTSEAKEMTFYCFANKSPLKRAI
ncbi:MAG: hypothetical protein IT342_14490 [Candidatus Melainabacteria bacterium]|nr:hypothetical protein [Candidatus Melainabacteria bacterium]